MNYLSVCSGIEAATVAWHGIGWNPVGFSEIESFPSTVLSHHYPEVTNFGDMTKFKEWNLDPNGVDLLVGGTPCQSFSVAGLRKGLDDPRGNLALTYCSMLDHFRPTWFIWENVPGVLSSSGGRDFGSFIGAVAELGYGFAYRVLDAQYFGVAQRRRRVFVVGHLGNWQRAAAVLFERQSLCRDTAPSRKTGEEVARSAAFSAGNSSNARSIGYIEEGTPPLRAGASGTNQVPTVITDTAKCLTRGACQRLDFETEDFVMQPMPFGVGERPDTAHCLRSGASKADKHESTTYVAQPIAFDTVQITSKTNRSRAEPGLPVGTMSKSSNLHVAHPVVLMDQGGSVMNVMQDGTVGTLRRETHGHEPSVVQGMAVRRLTPVECERLQGFSDNYTNIPWRKSSESPDGPRYKALGNSMAVPVMRWIGERINQVKGIV